MNHVKPLGRPGVPALVSAVFLAAALAGCGKVDPQLTAQQMTMTDAACTPAEIARIGDDDVRKAFQERCDRREQFKPAAPAN